MVVRLFLFISICLMAFSFLAQETTHQHEKQFAFMENKGQWDSQIFFKSQFEGGNLWVQQNKLVFHFQDYAFLNATHLGKTPKENVLNKEHVIHQNFLGSSKVSSIKKELPSENYYNFYQGNDARKWVSNVHAYSEATLENFYQGINLKLIEKHANLKYEFIVSPNSDYTLIKWDYAGNQGIHLKKNGNLEIETPLGKIIEHKPIAYQIIAGRIDTIDCVFKLENNIVSFLVANYRKDIELIIDPILVFATYSGSVTDNFGMTATYGYDATAYSGGTIYGNLYPTPDNNAYDINSNFTVANVVNSVTTDVFISKYAANGQTMIWTTFLGGGNNTQGTETIHSMICDKLNNIYVYGATSSVDFPIVNGFQATHGGGTPLQVLFNGSNFGTQGTDIYVAKISANGQNLMGSTYMGGSQNDGTNFKISSGNYNSVAAYDSLTTNYGDQFRGEIMLDNLENCLISSCSRSTNFPVLNAFQPANAGAQDGVVFKLTNNLSSLVWSSYYGGSNNDACYSVKVDSSYNIVFCGGTSSSDLTNTAGGWQATYNGGISDGFVVKLNTTGSTILQASYVGTSNYDQAFFAEIDRNDNVYLLGQSRGGSFPVNNATYSNPNSSQFIIKLNPNLTSVLNSTVFGNGNGAVNISPSAFLVDICGNMYVSGWGANILQNSPLNGMPISSNAFQTTAPNGFDFYLFVLDRNFSNLLYGSYIGGSAAQEHVDGGTSRFDKNGVVYQSVCGGCGGNSDFPTSPNAWSSQNLSSNCNNLVFKFDFQLIPNAEFTVDDAAGCAPFVVTFNNSSTVNDTYLWNFGNNDTTSLIFNPTFTFTNPGTYFIELYVTDGICLITDTAQITIQVGTPNQVEAGADILLCNPGLINLVANSFGTSNSFVWSTNTTFLPQLNASITDSTLAINVTENTTYYVQVSDGICTTYDSLIVNLATNGLNLTGNDSICKGETTVITATATGATFTYDWSPNNVLVSGEGTSTVIVNPPTSQYVYVNATSSNGCLLQDSIFVNVTFIDPLLFSATSNMYNVPIGDTVVLTAQPAGYSYQWTPISGLSNPNTQITNAVVLETTTYSVNIFAGDCGIVKSVTVNAYPYICGNPYFYFPNAFSPNGDGQNDVLLLRGIIVKEMLLRIYDRWGELVFETDQRAEGWDGTYKGKELKPDVYDYYLKAVCIDGVESIVKGNVTLLR